MLGDTRKLINAQEEAATKEKDRLPLPDGALLGTTGITLPGNDWNGWTGYDVAPPEDGDAGP